MKAINIPCFLGTEILNILTLKTHHGYVCRGKNCHITPHYRNFYSIYLFYRKIYSLNKSLEIANKGRIFLHSQKWRCRKWPFQFSTLYSAVGLVLYWICKLLLVKWLFCNINSIINEHVMSLHFLVSSSISLFQI